MTVTTVVLNHFLIVKYHLLYIFCFKIDCQSITFLLQDIKGWGGGIFLGTMCTKYVNPALRTLFVLYIFDKQVKNCLDTRSHLESLVRSLSVVAASINRFQPGAPMTHLLGSSQYQIRIFVQQNWQGESLGYLIQPTKSCMQTERSLYCCSLSLTNLVQLLTYLPSAPSLLYWIEQNRS